MIMVTTTEVFKQRYEATFSHSSILIVMNFLIFSKNGILKKSQNFLIPVLRKKLNGIRKTFIILVYKYWN